MAGWFAMKHGISAHHIFKKRPERMAVWVWLVDNAVYKDTPHDINGNTVTIKRGQVAASERHISEQTGVSYQSVRTFIARLKTEGMINAEITHGKSVITLCNYEKYQNAKSGANAGGNAALTHDQRIKEQDNNIPVGEAEKSAPSDVIDLSAPNAIVWGLGKSFLGGFPSVKNPGAVIGKWLKTNSPSDVIVAIEAARKSGTQDPVPYITQAMKPKHVQNAEEAKRVQSAWLM